MLHCTYNLLIYTFMLEVPLIGTSRPDRNKKKGGLACSTSSTS